MRTRYESVGRDLVQKLTVDARQNGPHMRAGTPNLPHILRERSTTETSIMLKRDHISEPFLNSSAARGIMTLKRCIQSKPALIRGAAYSSQALQCGLWTIPDKGT